MSVKKVKMHHPVMEAIITGGEVAALVEGMAEQVAASARADSNAAYASGIVVNTSVSSGRAPRVSSRVVATRLGSRVEAKRGTLARALGNAG